MSMTEGVYICVKGSLFASDCAAFGLTDKEVAALHSRFPNPGNSIQVVNGSYMKANPLQVINALSELGYEVVASSGTEAETTWTMRREVPVLLKMEEESHEHAGCCTTLPTPGVVQTLTELDFERGIWSAALFNEKDRLLKLLDSDTDPNIPDSAGYTALHYAARANHTAVSLLLIARGANVNAVTRAGQCTPLHRAASAGHEDMVSLLLDKGADITLKDADELTALDRAQKEGHEKIVKLLLEKYPEEDNKS